jgi:ribonucleoside-diphosphate reductase alpha chain
MYNCLAVETQFITSQGVKSFQDFNDGDVVEVLTHLGQWKKAVVRCHGQQMLRKIVIQRNTTEHVVWATENHKWISKQGNFQIGVSEGDRLLEGPDIFSHFDYDSAPPDERLYWAYGMVFGDGTKIQNAEGKPKYSAIRLCGKDRQYRYRFEELGFQTSSSLSLDGDCIAYTGTYLKTLPDPTIDEPRLIRAFVRGFLDADGERNRNCGKSQKNPSKNLFISIQQSNQEAIDFIRKCFPLAGVYLVSEKDYTGQETNFGTRGQTIRFHVFENLGKTAAQFNVTDISGERLEDVWCLEVEDDHSFVLSFGLATGNCTSSYCNRMRFFQECFWLLLCGCGTGFSVQRHHIAKLPRFFKERETKQKVFVIPDTIEGWADSLGVLLATYLPHPDFKEWKGYEVIFDYSQIRPAGSFLSSGAGKAPGPEPLRTALDQIRVLLDCCWESGRSRLRPIDAYDLVMHTSDAVLSGGVRRSATICIFSPDDEEMRTAKIGNWREVNPQRARSNNSALLLREETTKEEFLALLECVKEYGEPGFLWSDDREALFNPCGEISFTAYDDNGNSGWCFCNLCEINGRKVQCKEDFALAARAAAIIGTLQAGYTDFGYLGQVTKDIVEKEALLGVSITGMMDNPDVLFNKRAQKEMAKLVLKVNEWMAKKIGINPCARATCVKPAGTSSCVLGSASGIHPHHAKRYFRRVQANTMEPVFNYFKQFNPWASEQCVWSANQTDEVITFPIEVPTGAKTKNDLSAIEFLEHVKTTQNNWVAAGRREDRCVQPWLKHNVSNTIQVNPDEWKKVGDYIFRNRASFAGITLIPASGDLDYPQAPMVNVLTPREILQRYGDGSLLASGLVVDGIHAFNDLWVGCDAVLGNSEMPTEPKQPNGNSTMEDHRQWEVDHQQWEKQIDWVRRVNQFAERYCEGDVKQCTYLMKHVHCWKQWLDLTREYVDVDYTQLKEDEDVTKPMETIACAGGQCEMAL